MRNKETHYKNNKEDIMEIDLSTFKISMGKEKREKEFDIVEKGLFKGTQSNTEFLLNNWSEVMRRFHLMCLHMDACDKAFNKETKKFNRKRTKQEQKMAADAAAANRVFQSITTDKGKQDKFHSMEFEWERVIDMPNDNLTKIMLATIDLNWATRRSFKKLRKVHRSTVGLINLVTTRVEDEVSEFLERMEDKIDDM